MAKKCPECEKLKAKVVELQKTCLLIAGAIEDTPSNKFLLTLASILRADAEKE